MSTFKFDDMIHGIHSVVKYVVIESYIEYDQRLG